MTDEQRAALRVLSEAMPETDSPMKWRAAYDTLEAHYNALTTPVDWIGLSAFATLFFATTIGLGRVFPNLPSIGVVMGSAFTAGVLARVFLSAIPGFDRGKEIKLLAETLEPYRRYLNRREGLDANP